MNFCISFILGLYQESNGDVANSLCFVAGLYDVAHFSNRDLANCRLVVKLGANKKGLNQIVDFLEKDIYPILPYSQEVTVKGWCKQ